MSPVPPYNNPVARPTGEQRFAAMSTTEQDDQFGPEVAQALRDGKITLADLVTRTPMETEPDFITSATPKDLGIETKPKD